MAELQKRPGNLSGAKGSPTIAIGELGVDKAEEIGPRKRWWQMPYHDLAPRVRLRLLVPLHLPLSLLPFQLRKSRKKQLDSVPLLIVARANDVFHKAESQTIVAMVIHSHSLSHQLIIPSRTSRKVGRWNCVSSEQRARHCIVNGGGRDRERETSADSALDRAGQKMYAGAGRGPLFRPACNWEPNSVQ